MALSVETIADVSSAYSDRTGIREGEQGGLNLTISAWVRILGTLRSNDATATKTSLKK